MLRLLEDLQEIILDYQVRSYLTNFLDVKKVSDGATNGN